MNKINCRIGIDLGGTKIESIVIDYDGNEIYRKRIPNPKNDYNATLNSIKDLVHQSESETGLYGTIGIGIPGIISKQTNLVKNANSTVLIGKSLDKDLELILGRPVRLANDANCLALSEYIDGSGEQYNSLFGVILGTGVGGGLVIDGKIFPGANLISGEWGHNPLPWPDLNELPGPECYCGLSGCIETFLSGSGLENTYYKISGETVSANVISEKIQNNDQDAIKAIELYENRLARGLAIVVNILDPEIIVLAGGVSNISRLYSNVKNIWNKYIISTDEDVVTPIVQAKHGDSSGVRGAAWLWPEL
ncbi:MAG: ROK family protein [SAR202 cluster bacterium]|nr:ROK family protein [SAR202 cluster bacterium]